MLFKKYSVTNHLGDAMPYSKAHYLLLLLIPMIIVAFGPFYFFKLSEAPIAHHVHGISSSVWLLLLIAQSWLISLKKFQHHRLVGQFMFILVPVMIGAFTMIIHHGAMRAADGSPFYLHVGKGLLLVDIVLTFLTAWLVYQALKNRRNIHLHSGYMLSTMLGLLGPIIVRIFVGFIPAFKITSVETLYRFHYAVWLRIAVTIAIGGYLYFRDKKNGQPWLVATTVTTFGYILYATFGETDLWWQWIGKLAEVHPAAYFVTGFILGGLACNMGWVHGKKP